jgi:uncharacterized protein YdhG (YjbR/CyaY superfamily)
MTELINSEQYLAALPREQRTALERLRRTIIAAVPDAEEGLSYGMPAFKYRGRPLIYMGATKKHCALYGISAAIDSHADELAAFDVSKGTIRFAAGKPPSQALVRSLVRQRMREIDAADSTKPSRATRRLRR